MKIETPFPESTSRPQAERYYDMDWLRVFATLAVFTYHSTKPFTTGDWHINNTADSAPLILLETLLEPWIMPLFFLLSGASIALSLRARGGLQFVRERLTRLLVPLIFGILVIVPPQVYIERVGFGMFDGTFLQFYPRYFDGWYMGIGEPGNFAWMGLHLWYLLALLVFSLVLLPLFLLLKHRGTFLAPVGRWLEKPFGVFALALPLMALSAVLDPDGLGFHDLGSWSFPVYMLLMVYGYLLMRFVDYERAFHRYRGWALLIGVAALGTEMLPGAAHGTGAYVVQYAGRALAMWGFIAALIGFFVPLRAVGNDTLRYLSDAMLPFYILHQTVVVVIGYYVVLPMALPPLAKYGVLLVVCLPLTLGLYYLLVRRVNILRFLFGLKPRPATPRAVVTPGDTTGAVA